jgi:hypothetical protein
MPTPTWKPEYTGQALDRWEEYQRQHDLSNQIGRVAGIDPVSGRVWIDESGVEVATQMQREGLAVRWQYRRPLPMKENRDADRSCSTLLHRRFRRVRHVGG